MQEGSLSFASVLMSIGTAVLAPVLLILIGYQVYRIVGPAWMINRGRYAEARVLSARVAESVWRFVPSVRTASLYNVALCLHHEGELEEAILQLRRLPVDDADTNLGYAIASVFGKSLVLLERDPGEARWWMQKAIAIRKTPADLLSLAHAALSCGDVEAASAHFAESEAAPKKDGLALGKKTLLLQERALHQTMCDALGGWYLLRIGRVEDASSLLARAAASPLSNVYSERARAILARLKEGADVEQEAPSSLGAIVVQRGS